MNMEYAYYPGCTLETTSDSYDVSTRACANALKIGLDEMPEWNCCGATASPVTDPLLSSTINARNIAIGEKMGRDIVVPCSACFKNLHSTREKLLEDTKLRCKVNVALQEDGLKFKGTNRIRHFLDVCINDVGLDTVKAMVKRPLKGLKVATYYGCQIVRPENEFDSAEDPTLFEKLMGPLGVDVVDFPLKTKCCGASLIVTKNNIALKLIKNILQCAVNAKADIIVSACPLCQLNLDAYQKAVNNEYKTNFNIPILYFTQLMGLAFGIPMNRLGIGKEFIGATRILKKYI